MRRYLLLASLSLATACGPQWRADVIARTQIASPAPSAPLTATLGVKEQGAPHRLLYHVHLPRAIQLAWTWTCPNGLTQEGSVGETFEAYKARRIAQIQRDQQQKASLVGSVVGAVAPKVQAQGDVQTPEGTAHADGTVDPGKGAEQAALAAQGQAELPAGDVGEQSRDGMIDFTSTAAGDCTFAMVSKIDGQDTSGVSVDLTLEKMVDVRAERSAAAAAARAKAAEGAGHLRVDVTAGLTTRGAHTRSRQDMWQETIDLRAHLVASLETHGGDPGLRARERAAREEERRRQAQIRWDAQEARRKAAAERDYARQQAAQARWQAQYQLAQGGLHLRGELLISLEAHGADAGLRARIRAQHDAELAEKQREHDAQQAEKQREHDAEQAQRDAQQAERQAEENAKDAEDMREWDARQAQLAEQRRQAEEEVRADLQASLEIRAEIKEHLQLMGAVDRPPRPDDQVETPPAAPFEGAVWIGGEWDWNGAEWVWSGGHYEQPPARDVVWVAPTNVEVHGTISVRAPGRWVRVRGGAKGGVIVRDHTR
jgi:hypothetical protein